MPRYSRGRRSVKVSRSLRKKIKKVVEGVAEKKQIQAYSHDAGYYAAVDSSWGGFEPGAEGTQLQELTAGISNVVEGTGDYQRVGRDTTMTSFRLKGHFYLNTAGVPSITTMFIVSMKKFPQAVLDTQYPSVEHGEDPPSGGPSEIFYSGGINGSNFEGPKGRLVDLDSTVNSEEFTVHYKKVFKIGGPMTLDQVFSPGSGYALSRSFDINLKRMIHKRIRFSDIVPAGAEYPLLNTPKLFLSCSIRAKTISLCILLIKCMLRHLIPRRAPMLLLLSRTISMVRLLICRLVFFYLNKNKRS